MENGGKRQLFSDDAQSLISCCTKQGHTFPAEDNEWLMKKRALPLLRRRAAVFLCFLSSVRRTVKRKRVTVMIQTITGSGIAPDQRCGRGRRGWHRHGGVEGLWAKRVSEWQTGWPFSTLNWQMVIRGNYKGLLATNHLILLWELEPNVITALWYADPSA